MRAAAIVSPLPRRVDGASLFGKTLETVLAERPCRVVIESDAAAETTRAAGGRSSRPGGAVKALTRLHVGPAWSSSASAIIVRTVDAGGGAAAVGILVGLLFVAAGAGRLYLEREPRDPEEPR